MQAALLLVVLSSVLYLPGRLPAQVAVGRGAGPARTEDQIFDAQRQEPIALLRQLFEEKKVVVLGYPDHSHDAYHRVLSALLEQVGHDPQLKYIVSERQLFEEAALLEAASVAPMDEADLMRLPDRQKNRFCIPFEFSYDWVKLLPQIRSLNARRPAARPLRLTGVDGAIDGSTEYYKDREANSSAAFAAIWKGLAASEKVIVTYNMGHIVKGTKGRQNSWMQIFLQHYPEAEAQMAVVLVEYAAGNPTPHAGRAKLTQRQTARYPGQAWSVRLAPFRGVATERGGEIFDPKSDQAGHSDSTARLPDMFDAVLWWPSAASYEEALSGGESIPYGKKVMLKHYPKLCSQKFQFWRDSLHQRAFQDTARKILQDRTRARGVKD